MPDPTRSAGRIETGFDSGAFHLDFESALLSGESDRIAAYLTDESALKRFAVYRNNVVRAAIEALRSAYPAVERLVGPEFFAPMAKTYWEISPPKVRDLSLYGADFPRHIAVYAPARELPWLADVAQYDRAWLEAHHAADAPVLDAASASALDPAELPGLAPGLHPGVRILTSSWPAYEIWRANCENERVDAIDLDSGGQHGLVWRRGGEVRHMEISAGHAVFLGEIALGATLEAASESALAMQEEFDAVAAFGAALSEQILARGAERAEGRQL
jgi:hypothetical protein